MIPELQKGRVYYRCHLKSCETKTLREDRIEEAVLTFLKPYTLSDDKVNQLRSMFKQSLDKQTDNASAELATLELTKLNKRLSNLEDKLLDEVIDDETYERKKLDILFKQKHWQKVADQKINKQEKLNRLDKFLELVKSLCFTYISAVSAQKRELLKFVTSNRQIFTKKVELEPSKWLGLFEKVLDFEYCDQSRPTSRTFAAVESLLDELEEDELQEFMNDNSDNRQLVA